MHKKQKATDLLLQQKLLPLYYHEDPGVCVEILKALYAGGIRMLEFTHRGENALKNFNELKSTVKKSMHDVLLGIGTIKNAKQARLYIKAGADFIVSPSINEKVAKITAKAGLLWIPGCMTPTEIAVAENVGAKIVKIFPGNILGPSYITSIKELFPDIKFMPTGGVEAEQNNLKEWFNAGVVAVGMGSKLISKTVLENKNYAEITRLTKEALQIINFVSKPQ